MHARLRVAYHYVAAAVIKIISQQHNLPLSSAVPLEPSPSDNISSLS